MEAAYSFDTYIKIIILHTVTTETEILIGRGQSDAMLSQEEMVVVCLNVLSSEDICDPKSVHVLFMVDKIAVGQFFIQILRIFLVTIILSMLHVHSFIYHQCYVQNPGN
jgi:hypothetical protein